MSERSSIEWTDATWNPVTGCTKVSPGCAHCYAETFAERFRGVQGHPFAQGFDLKLWPERLRLPLSWRTPRKIFVNSMSDLFHENVPDDFIGQVFDVMALCRHHIFQVLTKRSKRMLQWTRERFRASDESGARDAGGGKAPWPDHVWLGVSVENHAYAWRIQDLRQTPATVKFLSLEPFLGPIRLSRQLSGIDWVIVGGESGPGARPAKPEWVCDVREQCIGRDIPFFFKQWGTHDAAGKRVGKKEAGRLLDGKTWGGFPNSILPGVAESL